MPETARKLSRKIIRIKQDFSCLWSVRNQQENWFPAYFLLNSCLIKQGDSVWESTPPDPLCILVEHQSWPYILVHNSSWPTMYTGLPHILAHHVYRSTTHPGPPCMLATTHPGPPCILVHHSYWPTMYTGPPLILAHHVYWSTTHPGPPCMLATTHPGPPCILVHHSPWPIMYTGPP